MVGLTDVAGQRVAGFSLGMGQRLGVAAALLGDPQTLILDEPVNGLDLDGIRWIRALLKRLADEGRTVFLSSHLMSEMAVTADHVIVVGQGRLLRDQPMAEFIEEASVESVRVVTPERDRFAEVLRQAGATVTVETRDGEGPGGRLEGDTAHALTVEGASSGEIGTLAAGAGVTVWELAPQRGLARGGLPRPDPRGPGLRRHRQPRRRRTPGARLMTTQADTGAPTDAAAPGSDPQDSEGQGSVRGRGRVLGRSTARSPSAASSRRSG